MSIGAIDLFCGVGGLTNGLKRANIDVVAGIDLDSFCEYPYTHNNNSHFISKSIEDVTGDEIKHLLEGYTTKVLVGCAPCQPFSSHQKNKQDRSKHKDWKLLYEFGRLVKESEPDIVSMENVPEIIHEQVFTDFVSILKEEKYFVEYKVVNVANYGVPQHRRRLILLASKKEPITLIPPTHDQYVTVRDTISNLPSIDAGQKNTQDKLHVAPSLTEKNLLRIRNSTPGGTWRDWPEDLILKCHKAETGKSYPSVYGRMCWDGLAPTITTQFTCYGTGRFGHPVQDRALTLREGALIQTFPQSYSFVKDGDPINMKRISRLIGNAVPPRLGEIVGISIQEHLKKEKNNEDSKND